MIDETTLQPTPANPMLTPEQLRWLDERIPKVINHLRPDHEVYSGRKFFERLLEYRGVEGVLAFIEKGQKALSDKGELDLYFDFDDVERDAFDKTRINYMSRRGFLGVGAVAASGAIFGLTGLLGLLRQLQELKNNTKEEWAYWKKELLTSGRENPPAKENMTLDKGIQYPVKPLRGVNLAEHLVQKELYPTAELLIGGALLNEAYDKRLEIKLEQIADAVTELDLKLRLEQERAKGGMGTSAPGRG